MPLPKAPTKKGSIVQLDNATSTVQPSIAQHHKPNTHSDTVQSRFVNTASKQLQIDAKKQAHSNIKERPAQTEPIQGLKQANQTKTVVSQTPPKSIHRKLFVLDTNVLLHDPSCFYRFEEHDLYLPLVTLEELDNHKKGSSETARNARSLSRLLDEMLVKNKTGSIENGIDISPNKNASSDFGRLYFQTNIIMDDLPRSLPSSKADNQILGVVNCLSKQHKNRDVILVSKDINMRIKARALGLNAEDYFNDQVLDDLDVLYSGQLALPQDFWHTHSKNMQSWQESQHIYYRVQGPLVSQMLFNQHVYLENQDDISFYGQVVALDENSATIKTLTDYTHPKHGIWGIGARNREQNFALNVLMDPDIDFVTLLGQAGTGKTLLTIAASLSQTLDASQYSQVIITRVTIPLGEDIGFLPGTEEEKLTPWMGALQDNLEILINGDTNSGEWAKAATHELIKNKIEIKAMSFMRGRTFVNKILIIDEAQNLTPKQIKSLITRAGPGTKVVCLGNLAQIDTPYLTEHSSGLAYAVEHFKNWPHGAHITLQRGERSRLADYANEVL